MKYTNNFTSVQIKHFYSQNPAEVMFQPGTLKAQRFLTAVNIRHPKYLEEVSRQLWLRAWSNVSIIQYTCKFSKLLRLYN